MTRVLPRSVGGPTQGGCSPPHATDPVEIPHDVENRRVATRFDHQLNPQISGPSRVPPQVTESARLNLSRWRHGFEPRWDYQETRRSEALSGAGEPSCAVFVPHLSCSGPPHVNNLAQSDQGSGCDCVNHPWGKRRDIAGPLVE